MFRLNDKHFSKLTALFLAAMLALPAMAWAETGNPKALPGASTPGHSYYLLENVEIPMRDGAIMRANIWIPEGEGPWPTVFNSTQYGNANPDQVIVEHGYVYVNRDTRGRNTSDGLFLVPNTTEIDDQYDTIEWIIAQDWSNGKVSALGASQMGQATLHAVFSGHPNLVCAVPIVTAENLWREWYYRGGALELGFLSWWSGNTFARNTATRLLEGDALTAFEDNLAIHSIEPSSFLDVIPLSNFELSAITEDYNLFKNWISRPVFDEYWAMHNTGSYTSAINIPLLHVGGWFDIFANGTIHTYLNARDNAYNSFARDNQYLVMGPWTHQERGQTNTEAVINLYGAGISTLDYGYESIIAFLDYWMKDLQHPGFDPNMHVTYFTGGDGGKWTRTADWPLPDAVETPYYLNGGVSGTIASLNDGTLSTSPAPSGTAPQTYAYDPMDPISTRGGNLLFQISYGEDGSSAASHVEQTPVDQRSLTFTSLPLTSNLEITGHISALLYASSDAVDTDWVVRLNDVAPDGTSINVADGILRARYRNSPTNPQLMEPGEVYEFEVDLWSTSYVFKEGHSLRVTVNSSSFPRWSRNMNVAEFPEQATEWVVANNTVYLDASYPSQIILPVVSK